MLPGNSATKMENFSFLGETWWMQIN